MTKKTEFQWLWIVNVFVGQESCCKSFKYNLSCSSSSFVLETVLNFYCIFTVVILFFSLTQPKSDNKKKEQFIPNHKQKLLAKAINPEQMVSIIWRNIQILDVGNHGEDSYGSLFYTYSPACVYGHLECAITCCKLPVLSPLKGIKVLF